MLTSLPTAAYIHVPFCRSKCNYCDFNSYPGMDGLFNDYAEAVVREIESTQPGSEGLDSIYFGGGTPTVLPPDTLLHILHALDLRFRLQSASEVTVEANPGTVDPAGLSMLRDGGFSRLSIGIQSFDDSMLALLGRIHTSGQAVDAYRMGREAGFQNISIDLMCGLPGQSLESWRETLQSALSLAPEHISLYELSIEEGTPFGNLQRKCGIELPDEDLQIAMYRATIGTLTQAGYEHYEISNFARAGRRSRHNQVYWRNGPYYGFGAGATGYVGGVRFTNVKRPKDYIRLIETSGRAVESEEKLVGRRAMGETVMLGLRMMDGVDLQAFLGRFGVALSETYGSEVAELTARGLIELAETHLKLTSRGLLVANEVAAEFL